VPELPRALIAVPVDDEVRQRLESVCRPAFVTTGEIAGLIADAEGVLCPAPYPITRELLDSAPRLRVVANHGVGFNNVDLPEMARRGIAVCNTPGVLSDAVAELTFGMILMASRRLPENQRFVHDGSWSAGRGAAPALGWDLVGKTLGLVGFGRIGKEVALRARAFRMKVIQFDAFSEAGAGWNDCERVSLDELLQRSDIVSLHVNLTPETHHLIGARELALMRPTAWLVNTARGPVVDQLALAAALTAGTIAGAVLDVLETEPPAADDPILSAPNAILLPHIGSATVETRKAMLDLAVRNLSAVLDGQRPPECVNPEVLERAMQRP